MSNALLLGSGKLFARCLRTCVTVGFHTPQNGSISGISSDKINSSTGV